MPYCVEADLLQRYGASEMRALSDIGTPKLAAVDSAVVQRAIADASAWLDGYLFGRYPLPITDTAALARLNLDCAAEARFLLMTNRVDEAAQKSHDERVAFYRSVAKGDIQLMPAAAVPAAVGAGPVLFDPGSKVFGREDALASRPPRDYGGWL